MISFKIEKGKLIIDEKTLIVPQFNDIWDYYEDKEKAEKMLIYIFAMADITIKNPYLDVAHYEKDSVIKNSVFKNSKHKFSREESQLINAAIPVYSELNRDSAYRMLESINYKIDEINKHMRTSKVKEDNLGSQVSMVTNTEKMLKAKAIAEDYVAKEVEKATKTQGDMMRSPLETGQLRYTPTETPQIVD